MAEGAGSGASDTSWRPSGRQIGIGICILLLVLFAALNLEKVRIDFLFVSLTIPLVFVIAGCSIVGFTAGYLFAHHLDKRDAASP